MSKKRGFSGDPVTVWRSGENGFRDMELAETLSFTDHVKEWVAEKGRVINGASIPRALWSVVGAPYVGRYRRPSIIHDVYCDDATSYRDRRSADRMFYRACRAEGLTRLSSAILYLGVRFGAWRSGGFLIEDDDQPKLATDLSDRETQDLFLEVAQPIVDSIENLASLPIDEEAEALEYAFDVAITKIAQDGKFAHRTGASESEFFSGEISGTHLLEAGAEPLAPDHSPLVTAGDVEIGGQLIKAPCGAENRVPVPNTDAYPHSAICYLIMNGKYRGTGFFVSPDTIVTAGHCIFGRFGYSRSVQIIPGRDDTNWPYGSVMASSLWVPREWRRRKSASFDYGVIKLSDKTVGEKVGHFEIASLTDQELLAAEITTAGYPSDIQPSRRQHINSGPCDAVSPQRLSYFLDTWRGASGSPVFLQRNGNPVVVGIHNYGHCPNRATRLNARVLADIKDRI